MNIVFYWKVSYRDEGPAKHLRVRIKMFITTYYAITLYGGLSQERTWVDLEPLCVASVVERPALERVVPEYIGSPFYNFINAP